MKSVCINLLQLRDAGLWNLRSSGVINPLLGYGAAFAIFSYHIFHQFFTIRFFFFCWEFPEEDVILVRCLLTAFCEKCSFTSWFLDRPFWFFLSTFLHWLILVVPRGFTHFDLLEMWIISCIILLFRTFFQGSFFNEDIFFFQRNSEMLTNSWKILFKFLRRVLLLLNDEALTNDEYFLVDLNEITEAVSAQFWLFLSFCRSSSKSSNCSKDLSS